MLMLQDETLMKYQKILNYISLSPNGFFSKWVFSFITICAI